MNQFLFACFFLISLVAQIICQQILFNVKQINTPRGTIITYGGKQYNSLKDVMNEINKQNSGIHLVTQVVPITKSSNYGFGSRYPFGGNNIYNGYSKYYPNSNGKNNILTNGGRYGLYYKPDKNNEKGNYDGNRPLSPNNINSYFKPNGPSSYGSYDYIKKIWDEVWSNYDYTKDYLYTDWKKRSYREQNLYRARHGASALTYDYDYLEKKAQSYAEYLSSKEIFVHDPSNSVNRIGENLAMSSKSQISTMTKSWYKEIQNYNFQKCEAQSGCGHFTQMIWKSTTKVGCGVSNSRRGLVYMVCKYSPAGNVIRFFAKNVNPPR